MPAIASTLLFRWIVVNAFLVAAFVVAFYHNVLDRFLVDQTYITHIIIGVFILTLAMMLKTVIQLHRGWTGLDERHLEYQEAVLNGRDVEKRELLTETLTGFVDGYKLMGNIFVSMGLLGTVVGILLAFEQIDPSLIADPGTAQELIVILLAGLVTAFNTTLAGLVATIWNTINLYLIRTELSRIYTTVIGK